MLLWYMDEHTIILLVEDREDDILLMKRSFRSARISNPLFVVRDGEEARQYLSAEGRYSNRAEFPLPDIILLDLNMPGMDGFELLSWIRNHPDLHSLRVVILTSSDQDDDIEQACQLRANSFLTKPDSFQDLVETARLFHDYWLHKDSAPEVSRSGKG